MANFFLFVDEKVYAGSLDVAYHYHMSKAIEDSYYEVFPLCGGDQTGLQCPLEPHFTATVSFHKDLPPSSTPSVSCK